jgi:3-isopropylmalate/(R)-2-methylmalate dehydratase small subunit
MEEIIRGKAYVLGENIDTDQIIPAKHLVYSLSNPEERKLYGKYALSGVPEAKAGLPQGNARFVEDGREHSVYKIIVAGKNFGCGSSREHAPVCLNIAGVQAVVAPSYARIFYRNAVDGGFFVPFESAEDLSGLIQTGDEVEIRVKEEKLANFTTGKNHRLRPLGDIADILTAGDVFAYARKAGLIKTPMPSTGAGSESCRISKD